MYFWFFLFWVVGTLSKIIEKTGSFWLALIVPIGAMICFSAYANALYHNNVNKRIAFAKIESGDQARVLEIIRSKGGVSKWVLWLAAIPIFGFLATIAITQYQIYVQRGTQRMLTTTQPSSAVAFPEADLKWDPNWKPKLDPSVAQDTLADLTRRAEQGDADAQYILARKYYEGDGVPRSADKGFEWYQMAAARGNAQAQFYVGTLSYQNGDGTTAVGLLEKSAAQGNSSAMTNLCVWYFGKNPMIVPADFMKAATWCQKGAAWGEIDSQANLGVLYYIGQGVPRDKVLSYAWANLAAGQGSTAGATNRHDIEQELTAAEIAEGQRLSASWKRGYVLGRQ